MDSSSQKPSPGNEHYSVDQMMDRLKQNDRDKRAKELAKDGELITRPDGSQVIKVRRRKRRSKQPAKKSPAKPKWLVLGCTIGLFVTFIAGIIFIIAKYNGRSFKEKTESNICELTGAESADLSRLRVTPLSAKASKIQINWGNDSFYQSAVFSDIKAGIMVTSFLSPDWIGEEIVAGQGKIQLQTPPAEQRTPDTSVTSNYRFDSFRCDNLDVQFGPENDDPSVTGIQASLRSGIDGNYQIIFNGGSLRIPAWPMLGISSGILTLGSSGTELEARLAASDNRKGELIINGTIPRDTSRPAALDVHAKSYPIQELLGKELGRIIQGDINSDMGSLSYDYQKENAEALSFIMPFNSSELSIGELPMFTDLKELTGDTQFVRPSLTHCRGTIMRTLEGVTLDHLHFVASRLLTLQGNILVARDGSLSGELEVGVAARYFGRNHPAPSIFSRPHNGYVRTKVTLGGSIYDPHDDLNARLRTGGTGPVKTSRSQDDTFPATPLSPLEEDQQKEKQFDELTR